MKKITDPKKYPEFYILYEEQENGEEGVSMHTKKSGESIDKESYCYRSEVITRYAIEIPKEVYRQMLRKDKDISTHARLGVLEAYQEGVHDAKQISHVC